MKQKTVLGVCLLPLCLAVLSVRAAAEGPPPDFNEVYGLLRANLAGLSEAELSRAAVQGFLSQLNGRATLVGAETPDHAPGSAPIRTAIYDGAFGCLRVGQLSAGSDAECASALRGLLATNRLKGIVFDLRAAGGDGYAAAAAIADAFCASGKPLLDWGDGLKKSTDKTNVISLPVAVLVDRKTRGAAEALAAILRQTDTGLLIGATTAGQASITKDFPLKNGQHLRIATTPIRLGDGRPFPLSGLKPDIEVQASPEADTSSLAAADKAPSKTSRLASARGAATNLNLSATNRPRTRVNEAELVRMLRDGEPLEGDRPSALVRVNEPAGQAGPGGLPEADPALARALDLLKGLAVVQPFRPR
jgi:hypothetical protein